MVSGTLNIVGLEIPEAFMISLIFLSPSQIIYKSQSQIFK